MYVWTDYEIMKKKKKKKNEKKKKKKKKNAKNIVRPLLDFRNVTGLSLRFGPSVFLQQPSLFVITII